MGITDRVGTVINSIQTGAKEASQSLFTLSIKVVSVTFLGLAIAMIFQELIGYGTLGFVFVLLASGAAFFRLVLKMSLGSMLVFDLICVLVASLLRMYILMAP
jgi:F0F1-type ATP synthase assembly protein I